MKVGWMWKDDHTLHAIQKNKHLLKLPLKCSFRCSTTAVQQGLMKAFLKFFWFTTKVKLKRTNFSIMWSIMSGLTMCQSNGWLKEWLARLNKFHSFDGSSKGSRAPKRAAQQQRRCEWKSILSSILESEMSPVESDRSWERFTRGKQKKNISIVAPASLTLCVSAHLRIQMNVVYICTSGSVLFWSGLGLTQDRAAEFQVPGPVCHRSSNNLYGHVSKRMSRRTITCPHWRVCGTGRAVEVQTWST